MRSATFFTIDKKYKTQNAQKKTKVCPSTQQSIELFGASVICVNIVRFSNQKTGKMVTGKKRKHIFRKFAFVCQITVTL